MPIEVLMPALSPSMERGNLAKWLKKEGDAVKSGDVIAEIETDKATMEVEAVDEGTLGKILVPEGTNDVAVNTPIAMILAEGEDAASLKSAKPSSRKAQLKSKPAATCTTKPSMSTSPASDGGSFVADRLVARIAELAVGVIAPAAHVAIDQDRAGV